MDVLLFLFETWREAFLSRWLLSLWVVPFLDAVFLVSLMRRASAKKVMLFSTATPLMQAGLLLIQYGNVMDGGDTFVLSWVPELGLAATLYADPLSWWFAFLVAGISALVFWYAGAYMHGESRLREFYACLLAFNGGMMLAVLADNFFLFYTGWEITSITSYLLIGFNHEQKEAQESAGMALTITVGGGIVKLFGIFLVWWSTGATGFSDLREVPLHTYPWSVWIALCFLIGALTKSAQVPFHFWLPRAMAGPAPVSAYLHSATMVVLGIYLVARMTPVFETIFVWHFLIATLGMATMVWGGYLACRQTDMKALLAYSTVSQLGLIMAILGIGGEYAVPTAMLYTANHAVFKCCLFFGVGAIEHCTGMRDLRQLRNLKAHMPYVVWLMFICSLSMAGVPFFGGFIAKELFFEAVLSSEWKIIWVMSALGGALTMLYTSKLWIPFFSTASERSVHHAPHDATVGMWGPMLALAGLTVLLGMPSVTEFAVAGLASKHAMHLALWHGLNGPFFMSAVALGIGGYAACHWWLQWPEVPGFLRQEKHEGFCERIYVRTMDAFMRFCAWLQEAHMTGHATDYFTYVMVASSAIIGFVTIRQFGWAAIPTFSGSISAPILSLAILITGAALACLFIRTRTFLLLTVGVVSIGFVGIYYLKGAPDLALTELVIGALTVLIFLTVFGMTGTMEFAAIRSYKRLMAHLAISGSIAFPIVLAVTAARAGLLYPSQVSPYYLENSVNLAGGRNVVNVILVDFRGYDTMFEITVIAVAVMGVFALMQPVQEMGRFAFRRLGSLPASPIFETVAPIMMYVLFLISLAVYAGGHNSPGGGFVGGVLGVIALSLVFLARGLPKNGDEWVQRMVAVSCAGVGVSLFTGLAAYMFGYPFLTSAVWHFSIPLWGTWELPSAMGFDTGVYFAVAGSLTGILLLIAGRSKWNTMFLT